MPAIAVITELANCCTPSKLDGDDGADDDGDVDDDDDGDGGVGGGGVDSAGSGGGLTGPFTPR